MSTVDKFGRPLPTSDDGSKSTGAAIVEGLQMDSEKHYNAHDRRIKKLGDAKDDSDAVNLKQLMGSIKILQEYFENQLMRTRRKFYDLLDGKSNKSANDTTVYDLEEKMDDFPESSTT